MTMKPACFDLQRKTDKLDIKGAKSKRSRTVLQERGLQLEAIVEAFDGLIYLCSQNYRIEFMNEQYVNRIGCDATGQVCYNLHFAC